MSVLCEPCAGIGYHTSFWCGPADDEAPLTGEMACDVVRAVCSTCHGMGRLSEARRRQYNTDLGAEDMRRSGHDALIRARHSWKLSRQR